MSLVQQLSYVDDWSQDNVRQCDVDSPEHAVALTLQPILGCPVGDIALALSEGKFFELLYADRKGEEDAGAEKPRTSAVSPLLALWDSTDDRVRQIACSAFACVLEHDRWCDTGHFLIRTGDDVLSAAVRLLRMFTSDASINSQFNAMVTLGTLDAKQLGIPAFYDELFSTVGKVMLDGTAAQQVIGLQLLHMFCGHYEFTQRALPVYCLRVLTGFVAEATWQPVAPAHARIRRSVRDSVCAVLALSARPDTSELRRLPLELVHLVLEWAVAVPAAFVQTACRVLALASCWQLGDVLTAGAAPALVPLLVPREKAKEEAVTEAKDVEGGEETEEGKVRREEEEEEERKEEDAKDAILRDGWTVVSLLAQHDIEVARSLIDPELLPRLVRCSEQTGHRQWASFAAMCRVDCRAVEDAGAFDSLKPILLSGTPFDWYSLVAVCEMPHMQEPLVRTGIADALELVKPSIGYAPLHLPDCLQPLRQFRSLQQAKDAVR